MAMSGTGKDTVLLRSRSRAGSSDSDEVILIALDENDGETKRSETTVRDVQELTQPRTPTSQSGPEETDSFDDGCDSSTAEEEEEITIIQISDTEINKSDFSDIEIKNEPDDDYEEDSYGPHSKGCRDLGVVVTDKQLPENLIGEAINGIYRCQFCPSKFFNQPKLVQHVQHHVKNGTIRKCRFCEYFSAVKSKLEDHERKHTLEKPFQCEDCGRNFRVRSDLSKHMVTHSTLRKHKCPICSYKSKTKRNLKRHMERHDPDMPRKFVCSLCGFAFKRESGLQEHVYRRHNDEKPFFCEECHFRCKTPWELGCHKAKHSSNRPYACTWPDCDKTFKTMSDCGKHIKRHQGIKNCVCSICSKSFPTGTALRKHAIVHSDDRNFQCAQCFKKFKTQRTLHLHTITHQTIKPYKCNVCFKMFATQVNLDTHKEVHGKGRPFQCPICMHSSRQMDHLFTHIGFDHLQMFTFICYLCRKPFRKSFHLQLHFQRCHKEDMKGKAEVMEYAPDYLDLDFRPDTDSHCDPTKYAKYMADEVFRASVKPDPDQNNSNDGEENKNENLRIPPVVQIARFSGIPVILARKMTGVKFNCQKKGKKPKCWFMDTALMTPEDAQRHREYLRKKKAGLCPWDRRKNLANKKAKRQKPGASSNLAKSKKPKASSMKRRGGRDSDGEEAREEWTDQDEEEEAYNLARQLVMQVDEHKAQTSASSRVRKPAIHFKNLPPDTFDGPSKVKSIKKEPGSPRTPTYAGCKTAIRSKNKTVVKCKLYKKGFQAKKKMSVHKKVLSFGRVTKNKPSKLQNRIKKSAADLKYVSALAMSCYNSTGAAANAQCWRNALRSSYTTGRFLLRAKREADEAPPVLVGDDQLEAVSDFRQKFFFQGLGLRLQPKKARSQALPDETGSAVMDNNMEVPILPMNNIDQTDMLLQQNETNFLSEPQSVDDVAEQGTGERKTNVEEMDAYQNFDDCSLQMRTGPCHVNTLIKGYSNIPQIQHISNQSLTGSLGVSDESISLSENLCNNSKHMKFTKKLNSTPAADSSSIHTADVCQEIVSVDPDFAQSLRPMDQSSISNCYHIRCLHVVMPDLGINPLTIEELQTLGIHTVNLNTALLPFETVTTTVASNKHDSCKSKDSSMSVAAKKSLKVQNRSQRLPSCKKPRTKLSEKGKDKKMKQFTAVQNQEADKMSHVAFSALLLATAVGRKETPAKGKVKKVSLSTRKNRVKTDVSASKRDTSLTNKSSKQTKPKKQCRYTAVGSDSSLVFQQSVVTGQNIHEKDFAVKIEVDDPIYDYLPVVQLQALETTGIAVPNNPVSHVVSNLFASDTSTESRAATEVFTTVSTPSRSKVPVRKSRTPKEKASDSAKKKKIVRSKKFNSTLLQSASSMECLEARVSAKVTVENDGYSDCRSLQEESVKSLSAKKRPAKSKIMAKKKRAADSSDSAATLSLSTCSDSVSVQSADFASPTASSSIILSTKSTDSPSPYWYKSTRFRRAKPPVTHPHSQAVVKIAKLIVSNDLNTPGCDHLNKESVRLENLEADDAETQVGMKSTSNLATRQEREVGISCDTYFQQLKPVVECTQTLLPAIDLTTKKSKVSQDTELNKARQLELSLTDRGNHSPSSDSAYSNVATKGIIIEDRARDQSSENGGETMALDRTLVDTDLYTMIPSKKSQHIFDAPLLHLKSKARPVLPDYSSVLPEYAAAANVDTTANTKVKKMNRSKTRKKKCIKPNTNSEKLTKRKRLISGDKSIGNAVLDKMAECGEPSFKKETDNITDNVEQPENDYLDNCDKKQSKACVETLMMAQVTQPDLNKSIMASSSIATSSSVHSLKVSTAKTTSKTAVKKNRKKQITQQILSPTLRAQQEMNPKKGKKLSLGNYSAHQQLWSKIEQAKANSASSKVQSCRRKTMFAKCSILPAETTWENRPKKSKHSFHGTPLRKAQNSAFKILKMTARARQVLAKHAPTKKLKRILYVETETENTPDLEPPKRKGRRPGPKVIIDRTQVNLCFETEDPLAVESVSDLHLASVNDSTLLNLATVPVEVLPQGVFTSQTTLAEHTQQSLQQQTNYFSQSNNSVAMSISCDGQDEVKPDMTQLNALYLDSTTKEPFSLHEVMMSIPLVVSTSHAFKASPSHQTDQACFEVKPLVGELDFISTFVSAEENPALVESVAHLTDTADNHKLSELVQLQNTGVDKAIKTVPQWGIATNARLTPDDLTSSGDLLTGPSAPFLTSSLLLETKNQQTTSTSSYGLGRKKKKELDQTFRPPGYIKKKTQVRAVPYRRSDRPKKLRLTDEQIRVADNLLDPNEPVRGPEDKNDESDLEIVSLDYTNVDLNAQRLSLENLRVDTFLFSGEDERRFSANGPAAAAGEDSAQQEGMGHQLDCDTFAAKGYVSDMMSFHSDHDGIMGLEEMSSAGLAKTLDVDSEQLLGDSSLGLNSFEENGAIVREGYLQEDILAVPEVPLTSWEFEEASAQHVDAENSDFYFQLSGSERDIDNIFFSQPQPANTSHVPMVQHTLVLKGTNNRVQVPMHSDSRTLTVVVKTGDGK